MTVISLALATTVTKGKKGDRGQKWGGAKESVAQRVSEKGRKVSDLFVKQ